MSLITPENSNVSHQQIQERERMEAFAKMVKNGEDMKCEKCGSLHFTNVHRIKMLSGLVTGTGQDMVVPIAIFACADCGHVNEYFANKVNSGEVE